ncbi:GNAT family N-acetyltransferase [Cohnella nanjingensis]|uniref:Bifunctional AAC/APH n=1 Tax=Cohnella nanjingensis TaxID=1387779 RepID=A0A7X0RRT2_9BACL|nr:GNAT family N-acetyltransferase [Cohnella nanjingensis]MBB6671326.1 GNAT family N-acetyltransferase [Cohnella nanjingensis]
MQPIGEGRTAAIFAQGQDRILKLYYAFIPEEDVRYEYRVSRFVASMDLDVPQVYERAEADGRQGIVFERIDGVAMLRQMIAEPEALDDLSRRMAQLHLAIHGSNVPGESGLLNQADYLARQIRHTDRLSEREKADILGNLSQLPAASALCHGDFHPDNIMLGERAWTIDWMNGMTGHPAGDVARTLLLLTYGTLPEDTPVPIRDALNRTRTRIREVYLAEYLAGSDLTMAEIESWFLAVTAARLAEGVPDEEKTTLLALIRERLEAGRMMTEVTLREVVEADLPIFYEHQLDEEANRMAAFTAKDPHDKPAFAAHWTKLLGDERILARTVLADGQAAGHILSYPSFGETEITYWIGRAFWGQGVATSAVSQFLRVQEERPLFARAAKDHLASLKVLERNGFKIVSEDRGFANARGEEIEEYVLRLGAEG